MSLKFLQGRHDSVPTSTSRYIVYQSRLQTREADTIIIKLGRRIFQPKRFLCLGATATSLVTFLVLSKVHQIDSPELSRRHIHNTSHYRHIEDSHAHRDNIKQETNTEAPIMSKPKISASLKKAKEEAVWGMFVGDALAMPVHWYYNPDDIKSGYGGWLTGYTTPNKKHPSSIISLSAVGGSGRGSDKSKPIIGNVILHDKLKYWSANNRSTHYHQGMKAGDSTLNSLMALEMLKTFEKVDHELMKADRDVRGKVLQDYVTFMTTPGSHGDTYAESFHRAFFKDWAALSEPPKTADDLLRFSEARYKEKTREFPDSQLAVVGALVPTIPWVLRNVHKSEAECAKAAVEFIKLTHPVTSLVPFIDIYARLLHGVLNGHDLKAESLKLLGHSELGGPQKREMVLRMLEKVESLPEGSESRLRAYQSVVSQLGMACYIEGALSSLLFLAIEFHDNFEGGVLANANVGGENCHRGAALGALLGAAAANRGDGVPQKWKDGLGSARGGVRTVLSDMAKL